MNDGGKPTGFATSSAAPLDDKLRTVHSTPLPPNAMVAPFRTLYRGADLFSIMGSIIAVICSGCEILRKPTAAGLQTDKSGRFHRCLHIYDWFTFNTLQMPLRAAGAGSQHRKRARDHRHRLVVGGAQ